MHMIGKALTILSLLQLTPARAQEVPLNPETFPDSLELFVAADSFARSDTATLAFEDAFDVGQRILEATLEAANSYKEKPGERLCYRYVKQGLRTALGVSLTGGHAYQAAAQLARLDLFTEVSKKTSELPSLPAGSVVVWNRSKARPHGHISVADGQGKEVSDRVRDQLTGYGTTVRVFVPAATVQSWSGSQ